MELVPIDDRVSHPIQTIKPSLHSVDPFESLDLCPISDDLLPSDEFFLEYMIQFGILMDVNSFVLNLALTFLVILIHLLIDPPMFSLLGL